MGSTAAAPDVLQQDQYSGLAACSQLTEDKIDEYAATVKFIKLLAGFGPDDEVEAARNAVREAVARVFEVPDELLAAEAAAREAEQRFLEENRRVFEGDESLAQDATLRPAIYLSDSAYAHLYEDGAWMDAWEANNAANENAVRTAVRIDREEWQAWIQGWIDWFNEIRIKLSEGRVLEMICAVLVEGTFMVMEEVVTWGIAAAAAVVTGGVGAVAVKIVARATIAGSRTARISVRAVRAGRSPALTRQSLGRANDVEYPHIVDANDLEGIEARILDEEFYGGRTNADGLIEDLTPPSDRPTTTRIDGDGDGAPIPQTSGRAVSDEEWERLRGQTPSNSVRSDIQSRYPVASRASPVDDDWLPGLQRTGTIEADHIVPAARIRNMDGFADLTEAHRLEVLNYAENFHGMSRSANASRGDLSFSDWTMHQRTGTLVNPELRLRMMAEEQRLEEVIQGMIYERLRRQNAGQDVQFRGQ